ncbi:MAG TPA: hypothetical protein VM471_00655 [Phenylobacterium sp.]|nr:hypothetical protein [Phenylobacterium sp.]
MQAVGGLARQLGREGLVPLAEFVAGLADGVSEHRQRIGHGFGLGFDLFGDLFAGSLGKVGRLAPNGLAYVA